MMNSEIFTQYGDDPMVLFSQWYDEAVILEPNDPEAICLASADKNGIPSARMVLLKEFSDRGFKFHTNENSAKGQNIADNPHVSFCLYWKSTRKQIRVTGVAETVSNAESDAYFKTRPRCRAIGAWASQQSQSYNRQEDLANAITHAEEKFKTDNEIPRPPQWKGYIIKPTSIEFWIANQDRLHTRFIYNRNDNGKWDTHWLHP